MQDYITFSQGLILVKLLIAHFVNDFVLQSNSDIKDKKKRRWGSSLLLKHAVLAGLTSYLLLMLWDNWYVPLAITVSHYFIDLWKTRKDDDLRVFLFDQLLHIFVLVCVWFVLISGWSQFIHWAQVELNDHRIWIIFLGFLFVISPCQYIVEKATVAWRKSFSEDEGLRSAGKWIGILERVMILLLVLNNQYGAIGFLIAGKAIIRFFDGDKRSRAKSEYVLIGTLISFTLAVTDGIIVASLIRQ